MCIAFLCIVSIKQSYCFENLSFVNISRPFYIEGERLFCDKNVSRQSYRCLEAVCQFHVGLEKDMMRGVLWETGSMAIHGHACQIVNLTQNIATRILV